MLKRKRFWVIIGLVLVALVIALFVAGNYFVDFALKAGRKDQASGAPQGEVTGTSETASAREARVWLEDNAQDVFIQSDDGLALHAYEALQTGHRYAIVVHGYTGNGRSMAGFGRRFFERGFSVLLPDCRGQGESGGDFIGMGWPDRLDILRWVDRIVSQDADAEIILYGISMGGATVMMTAGEPMPPQVKLVIEDCGYSSVWAEFSYQLREQFGLPPFPIMQAANVVTRLQAGYWLSEADAIKQVAKAEVPMLFIHGEADTYVPFSMLEPLYEAKQGEKEKLVVPSAEHGEASVVDPAGYWEAIDTFLDRHLAS